MVALNTMLCAGDINEQLVQRKMEIRDEAANRIIWNAVMTKTVAIALNPITVVDILSGAVIDVVMILTLSKVYGIAMTEAGAVELPASFKALMRLSARVMTTVAHRI